MARETQKEKIERLEKELSDYKQIVKNLMKEKVELKEEINKLKDKKTSAAGRKEKFTPQQVEKIKQLRAAGKSIRAIAAVNKCSVGLVHKLINEQK